MSNKLGQIIGHEHNLVRVDFRRPSDPPAPKFPGASGLRPLKRQVCEPDCTADWVGVSGPLYRRPPNYYLDAAIPKKLAGSGTG